MERSLLAEVTKPSLKARLLSNKVKAVYYPNFFGTVPVIDLKWETLTGEKGAPVMAEVVSYDSSAPEKTRQVVKKMSGDINKISVARSLNERDWIKYTTLKNLAGSDTNKQALLDLVFKDIDFVYNGVRARMEWYCMQAMSKGSITLDSTNSAGLITETAIDFGVDSKYGFGDSGFGGAAWSNANSSKPTVDIDKMVELARANGHILSYMIMSTREFNNFKRSADVIANCKAYVNVQQKYALTLNVVNEFLSANAYPQIIIIDPLVTFENEDHIPTTINPWAEGKVTFLTDMAVGDIQNAPLMSESSDAYNKIAITAKQDFTLISKYSELNPVKEVTIGEANAFPVLNDPQAIYMFDSLNASFT